MTNELHKYIMDNYDGYTFNSLGGGHITVRIWGGDAHIKNCNTIKEFKQLIKKEEERQDKNRLSYHIGMVDILKKKLK